MLRRSRGHRETCSIASPAGAVRGGARTRAAIGLCLLTVLMIIASGSAVRAETIVAAINPDLFPLYDRERSGKPTGFAIEVMNELAKRGGFEVTFRTFDTWAAIVNALEQHEADVVPLLNITPDRERRVIFTRPFEDWHLSMFVRRGDRTLAGKDDLAGRRIGAMQGSASAETVTRRYPRAVIVPYSGVDHLLIALLSGEVDAVVVGEPAMWSVSQKANLAHYLETVGQPLTVGKMAIAVRADQPQLRDRLDELLAAFIQTSEFERLYTKWHVSPPPYWTAPRVARTVGIALLLLGILFLGWVAVQRRNANRRLDESFRRLSALLDNIPDLAWMLDRGGRVIAVNQAFAAACGRLASDIVGKAHLDVWPAGIGHRDGALEVVRTSQARRIEAQSIDARGDTCWIETIKSPILDERGRVIGTTGIARDITARKQMEEALRGSEARLRKFIEAAPVAIAMFDRDMRYLAVSQRFITDYNLDTTDLVGLSHYEVFPEIPPTWREIHQRCLAGAVERSDGELFVRADGSHNWIRWEIQPWYEPQGGIGGMIIFSEDISARKVAEEALLREKERALTTLHSIGDAVITTDAAEIIDYLNPVAERLTGWSCADAVGRSMPEVFRIVDEETGESAVDPVAGCLHKGRTSDLSGKLLIDRKGHKRAIEDSASPIRTPDGKILGAVLVFHDISETKRMAQQLQYDAAHDALTGLVNRREFERRLERAVETAQKQGIEHALCYFDLDQFKLVNDTAGHAAGDALLQRVRGLLAGKFRERDTLARLGGDEFALLLETCGPGEAVRIAESIVRTFGEWRFLWEGRMFQVGASAGIVPITAKSLSAADLLSKADVACYTAKERGRGRVHLYRDSVAGRSKHHAELLVAATLTEALEQRRFRLFAQPIVSLTGDDAEVVRHHEVLIRLLDSDGRLVPPSAFVPAAERYGLMPTIDRWVISNALSAYEGSAGAAQGVELSINLSGASLNSEELLKFVLAQFERYDVQPDRVCFEITETAAIHHLDHAIHFVAELRRCGSRIALDDFGGGVSSFRYLRMLTADYLKIDGSFVQHVVDNPTDEAVVTAINDVGHSLGFATVAEYACSDAIVDRLRRMGVNYAQGYALGMPQPLEVALAGENVVSVATHPRAVAASQRFTRSKPH